MAKKRRSLKGKALPRTLSVSLAGIRAGSALAVDSVVQRVLGRGPDDEDSEFARREARRRRPQQLAARVEPAGALNTRLDHALREPAQRVRGGNLLEPGRYDVFAIGIGPVHLGAALAGELGDHRS